MNFSDIVKLYDKNHGIVGVNTDYSDTKNSHYSDMQKKLKKAFECVGISDLSWLKDANGKNYEFKDGEDEYIIHLIEMDTSPLFKEIRNKGLKHTDWYTSGSKEYYKDDDFYEEYLSEISRLCKFIVDHVGKERAESICMNIHGITSISRLIKYAEIRYNRFDLYECLCSLVQGRGEANFRMALSLTEGDREYLLDELLESVNRWRKLLEDILEYREDEFVEAAYSDENMRNNVYFEVNMGIAPLMDEKCKNIRVAQPRNFASRDKKQKEIEQKIEEIKLELAKEYCEKYNFDFEKYLEQKKIVESMKTPRVSTEEMLEEIRES